MKRFGAIAAAAAMLGSDAAVAQERAWPVDQDALCQDLRRLADDAPDFEGVYKSRAAPPWLGFRPGACRASAGSDRSPPQYWCHQSLAPAHLTLDGLAAMTASCLPDARRLPTLWAREAVFESPRLRVSISESGGPGAHVGRILSYRVEAIDPTR